MGSEWLERGAAIGLDKYDMSRFKLKRLSSDKESCMKFGWDEKENRNWILMGVIFGAVEWCVTLPYRVAKALYRVVRFPDRIVKSLYKYLTKS